MRCVVLTLRSSAGARTTVACSTFVAFPPRTTQRWPRQWSLRRATSPDPMHVIATAGHVDHGKSTLIRALTGMEPDRWAEERRRGMTIDLGFAWTSLPSGEQVAF